MIDEAPKTGAPRAVIITASGFQDDDVFYCYYRLEEEGYDVDVATKEAMRVVGRYGVSLPLDTATKPNLSFTVLSVEAYDAVIIAGDHRAPDRVGQERAVVEFVQAMDAAGKIVGGLSMRPWIMVPASSTSGSDVVTCSHYRSMRPFMRTLLDGVAARGAPGWRSAAEREPQLGVLAQPREGAVARRADRPPRHPKLQRQLLV